MVTYLAGPLFTLAERRFNRDLAAAIRAVDPDIEVTLPQEADRDMGHGADQEAIFRHCIEGIDRADVVLAVLDGTDADSGTAFECGYAFALGKPVVGLRADFRGDSEPAVNAMLRRSAKVWVAVHPADADMAGLGRRLAAILREVCQGENDGG